MGETPSRFSIEKFTEDPAVSGLFSGTVTFGFDDEIKDVGVTQVVRVSVRIKGTSRDTLESLHEALFAEAVATLGRALDASQGRSPQELLSATRTARAAEERGLLDDLSDDFRDLT